MNASLIYYTLEIGLLYGLIALGIYLTLRIIDFPDLTVNSSFTLGAAVSTIAIIEGYNPIIATFCAALAGCLAGATTAFLNLQFKVQNLLASIIVMIGLHSINLRIMGKPNLILLQQSVIYDHSPTIIVTAAIVIGAALLLARFIRSEIGLGIRASGQSPLMASAYGINYNTAVYTVLIISNGLVALSGSMLSQLQGFCDISMGNGIIVIGLASVIVSERIISTRNITYIVIACILGAITYNALIAIALNAAGTILRASDIYLITAILIVGIMCSNRSTNLWK